MISLAEVRTSCARKNDLSNRRLHFFASRFSIYFSWLFINLGLSANQVTALFFVVGFIGGLCFLNPEPIFVFAGYVLWRLHIIFDLCDGDVARYTQKFSINGAYWDYMIHSILYPLYFVGACASAYMRYEADHFLFIGAFGGIIVSQILSVKNNYYRAMLFNKLELVKGESSDSVAKRNLVKELTLHILSFEGFLFVYVLVVLLGLGELAEVFVFAFYLLVFLALIAAKFYLFSVKGNYSKRA